LKQNLEQKNYGENIWKIKLKNRFGRKKFREQKFRSEKNGRKKLKINFRRQLKSGNKNLG